MKQIKYNTDKVQQKTP